MNNNMAQNLHENIGGHSIYIGSVHPGHLAEVSEEPDLWNIWYQLYKLYKLDMSSAYENRILRDCCPSGSCIIL